MRPRNDRFLVFIVTMFVVTTGAIGVFAGLAPSVAPSRCLAADWPQWRFDARRSASSPEVLPPRLELLWTRELPPLTPAYHSSRLQFDRGYEPIAAAGKLFVGSSRNDRMTAYDAESGEEIWRFYAGGPIRCAPVYGRSRLYFGSDDGFLYCLDAGDGKLRWKFRAAPSGRKVLGNRRMISLWPIRGGPVLADGRIYFAAGVWSFEGVFIYCVDAGTGKVIWLNDRSGYLYGSHPHGAEALGGLTPQGYLVVNGDELVVPCGTAYPARLELATGKLVSFALPKRSRYPGGWFVAAGEARDEEADRARRRGKLRFDSDVNSERHEDRPRVGKGEQAVASTVQLGDQVIRFADATWKLPGVTHSVLAAEGRVFVVKLDGNIYCLGPAAKGARTLKTVTEARETAGGPSGIAPILRGAGARFGHALVVGAGDGSIIDELCRVSELRLLVAEPDAKRAASLRRSYDRAGLYGDRVAIIAGEATELDLPPYWASLIVTGDPERPVYRSGTLETLFRSLRPHGGVAALDVAPSRLRALKLAAGALEGAKTSTRGRWFLLQRPGALAGAVNYTGGWKSPDDRVRAPLGVLWFDDSLGQFKRSPQPKFVDGWMVSRPKSWLAGRKEPDDYDLLDAVYSDVYTGRVLSAAEVRARRKELPRCEWLARQPSQYRPPSQKDAWNPAPPRPGRRINPLTLREEVRVFPKSYGCDGGIAYGNVFTMRSGTAAFYDMRLESGTICISGPRSGCTNSLIPACGVLNVPYFYEGCTCSYPLPVGLALSSREETFEQWAIWGEGPAAPEEIQRVGINLGAPGDRMTRDGTLWLDYPPVGGPSPRLQLSTVPESPQVDYRHSLWIRGGRGWPWVAASGLRGLQSLKLSGLKKGIYTVRLYFCDLQSTARARSVFDLRVQGEESLSDLDIAARAGGAFRSHVEELAEVFVVDGTFTVELEASSGETSLSGVELIRHGLEPGAIPRLPERDTTTLFPE